MNSQNCQNPTFWQKSCLPLSLQYFWLRLHLLYFNSKICAIKHLIWRLCPHMTREGFPRILLLIDKCSFPSHQFLFYLNLLCKKSARKDLDTSEQWQNVLLQVKVSLGYVVNVGLKRERWEGWGGRINVPLWYGLIIATIYKTFFFDFMMRRVFWILSIAHPSLACSKPMSVSFGKGKKPQQWPWLRVTMWSTFKSEPQTGLAYSKVLKAHNFASVNVDYFNFVFLSPATSLSSAQLSCRSHMPTGQQASCLIVSVKTKQSIPHWSS